MNQKKNIKNERLELKDFSYGCVPPSKYTNRIYDIYIGHFNGERTVDEVYFHCKAGVNRSFRTAAIFQVLFQIIGKTEILSLSNIAQTSWKICNEIKKKRKCVDFNSGNYLKQASFVATTATHVLIRLGRLKYDTKIDVKYGLTKYVLQAQIEELYDDRINKTDFLSRTARFFGCYSNAIPRNQKTNAQKKIMGALEGHKKSFDENDLQALFDGRTGKALLAAPHEVLPEELQEHHKLASSLTLYDNPPLQTY